MRLVAATNPSVDLCFGDAAKMVRNWGGGVLEGSMMTLLHRVVFYGDHMQSARHMTDLLGMEVVEEG